MTSYTTCYRYSSSYPSETILVVARSYNPVLTVIHRATVLILELAMSKRTDSNKWIICLNKPSLYFLPRTRLGQAIISQAVCISHLLYLLVDQRPSPKLVLTVLQLLRLALPLLSSAQCAVVSIPTNHEVKHQTSPLFSSESRYLSILQYLIINLLRAVTG